MQVAQLQHQTERQTMKTRDECTELATMAIGEYLSACLPESQQDIINPLTLLASVCGHACVTFIGREAAASAMRAIADDILRTTKVLEVTGTGKPHPTLQ